MATLILDLEWDEAYQTLLTSLDWKLSTSLANATQQLSTDFLSYKKWTRKGKENKHSDFVKQRSFVNSGSPSSWAVQKFTSSLFGNKHQVAESLQF